ncbi:MAG: hypothetical protein ACW99Q_08645 [Candidatus Kariarchaeaceae archaeon]|jgi:hypothetical protein
MKLASKILVLFALLLLIGISDNVLASDPAGGNDRDYYFRIELSQWSIKAYDMNQIEDLMLQGVSKDKAIKLSTYDHRIGSLVQGSHVFLEIYSFDVQHGLLARELDLSIVVNGRQPSDNYHKPVFQDFDLPKSDTTISISCHVYCGLGHSEMKLNFVIGDGSPNYSKIIISAFIGVNLIIFLIIFFSLFKRVPTKIMLYPLESNAIDAKLYIGDPPYNNLKNGNKIGLFRVSHLSEKQIILLRFNKMKIEELGDLIGFYICENVEQAMALVKTIRQSNNWEIVD